MTITCPNCRNDFRTGKLSTEKVNVVVCPHCRMLFPYTLKHPTPDEKTVAAHEVQSAAPAPAEIQTRKSTAPAISSFLGSGGEDFLRQQDLEEKRELLRRERELRYERAALEYRLKLLEEKERLEQREAERRRALDELEGFIRVGAIAAASVMPLETPAVPEDHTEITEREEPVAEILIPPVKTLLTVTEAPLAETPVTETHESESAQRAFAFDKPAVLDIPDVSFEATPSADFSSEAEAELKLYETDESEAIAENEQNAKGESLPSVGASPAFEPEPELLIDESAASVASTEVFYEETVSREPQLEAMGDLVEEAETVAVVDAEEPETFVVEVEESADNEEIAEVRVAEYEEESEAEVHVIEHGGEERILIITETRLLDEEPEDGASAAVHSEIGAVIERVQLMEEEAHIQESSQTEETPEISVTAVVGEPVTSDERARQTEATWYHAGDMITNHGIERVIVTGVKLLDEEAPQEEQDESVKRFFAQVEEEAEKVSDSELEASLRADVDQVVSEIEDMETRREEAVTPAYFETRSEDTSIIELPQSESEPVIETSEKSEVETMQKNTIEEIRTAPNETVPAAEIEQVSKLEPKPEPVAPPAARPLEMTTEEIRLRQEEEKSRRHATQQFYSSQFQNIKMQRDVERRIIEEKERLAAEAAEQKHPAGTEISRMKRNLQIGAALFGILVIAQILLYIFGSSN